jgi:hypothetical protein
MIFTGNNRDPIRLVVQPNDREKAELNLYDLLKYHFEAKVDRINKFCENCKQDCRFEHQVYFCKFMYFLVYIHSSIFNSIFFQCYIFICFFLSLLL